MRKFKKFSVTTDEFDTIEKDVEYLSHKYREKFNFSRFHRLCSRKMTDEDFLLEIGYFHTVKDLQTAINSALFPKK